MSLARFALRTSALHALRDATLVGDNVRDSDITAIDVSSDGALRTDEDRPFILIYTDDGTAEDADLRDLRENGLTDFVCEFGIASAMTSTNEQGETTIVGVNVPGTDANFEMTLDIIDRQIVAALTGPAPWADLWRRLSRKVTRIERRRAASAEDGTRVAARQLRIRLDAIPDPAWGQPLAPTSVWLSFADALADADPDAAAVLGAFLGDQDPALTADLIRRARGHTFGEARHLGYGPFHAGGVAFRIAAPEIAADG